MMNGIAQFVKGHEFIKGDITIFSIRVDWNKNKKFSWADSKKSSQEQYQQTKIVINPFSENARPPPSLFLKL